MAKQFWWVSKSNAFLYSQPSRCKIPPEASFLEAAVKTAEEILIWNLSGTFNQGCGHNSEDKDKQDGEWQYRQNIKRKRNLKNRLDDIYHFFKRSRKDQIMAVNSPFIQKTLREGSRRMALPRNPALIPVHFTAEGQRYDECTAQKQCFSELSIADIFHGTNPIHGYLSDVYYYEKSNDPRMFNSAIDAISLQTDDWSILSRKTLQQFPSNTILKIDSGIITSTIAHKFDICSVQVPPGITEIGRKAFHRCSRLKNVTFPDTIEVFDNEAFSWCISLQYVSLPSGIKVIGEAAFDGNLSLRSVVMPTSVTSLGHNLFRLCMSLTYVSLPASLTSIPRGAFQYCVNLTHVDLPASVADIGSHSFAHCVSLSSLWLPDSVKKIGDHAFQACVKFAQVKLPALTKHNLKIGKNVFYQCNNLKAVVFRPASSPVCVVWALGQSRNRDNWKVTTIKYTRNILIKIINYAVTRDVFEFDPTRLTPIMRKDMRKEKRKLIPIIIPAP